MIRVRREAHRLVRAWMRGLLRILNVSLSVRGNIQPGAALYCANLFSWLDIPCLRALVDAAFIAKSEVRRWPTPRAGRLSRRWNMTLM